MAVLLFAENAGGTFKKAVLEAATYAKDLADMLGQDAIAVSIGEVSSAELARLAEHGISKTYSITEANLAQFNDRAYAGAIMAVAQAASAQAVVIAQTYNGKAVAPRIAIRLNASLISGATSMLYNEGGFCCKKLSNSGKGIETLKMSRTNMVISPKTNSYGIKTNPVAGTVEAFTYAAPASDFSVTHKETVKASAKISITEADTVVSGGRGLKGPENWHLLESLAEALNAGTACSKPVADMDWRPHHEHVGQTGIQIAPNLYIALGISGAIQHLAGVNSSKNIVVINKDPEAPFFKIADYGIVGDLFEVLPRITEAVKKMKATS
jgi:electron transfer flavoprotein alpha subunit